MKLFKRIFAAGLISGLAALFVNSAGAADITFDGASGGLSLTEYIQDVPLDQPRLTATPAAAGAHVYDFKTLYRSLGYPSPHYFGSSKEEVEDLHNYTSKEDGIYEEINGYLRFYPEPYTWYGTSPESAKIIVAHVDNIFARVPAIPADIILFRGLGLGYRADKPFDMGEEFIDKGYVSTSLSYSVALHFAIEMNEDDEKPTRRAIFVIYLDRPGEKGILVNQGEDEVILNRGRKFRVMAQKDGVKKYDLYLVQACAASCETTLRGDVQYFWTAFNVSE